MEAWRLTWDGRERRDLLTCVDDGYGRRWLCAAEPAFPDGLDAESSGAHTQTSVYAAACGAATAAAEKAWYPVAPGILCCTIC
jgi:hypothetical protein